MRLATLRRGGRDGTLVLVNDDGTRACPVPGWPTMQAALDDWDAALPALTTAHAGAGSGDAVAATDFAAPLPRAWQWLDGSAFPTHGDLMQQAFGLPPVESDRPLMYQGMSHRFLAPTDDVPLPSEADGIDFEGEFGVVTGDVPMGCSAAEALAHIRLVVMLNDWSLRAIAPVEMKTGFGWVRAKPACSVAPFAVTPDDLGDAWRDGRVHLPLTVEVNGEWFGSPVGGVMAYGFHDLIAHAAYSRALPAGTIIGSGTVSNPDHARVGSTCLSERRAIEMIAHGAARTPFLSFGDRVRMTAGTGAASPFGTIDQRVVGDVDQFLGFESLSMIERHQIVRVRREPRRRTLTVVRSELLGASLLRVHFACDDLADFDSPAPDDHVKLFLAGAPQAGDRPPMRDYTPRAWDVGAGSFVIDFALHDAGPATAWARAARPGDEIQIGGPRGSQLVSDDFDWYLLIGDETALPAIARWMETLRSGVPVTAIVAVGSVRDVFPLPARDESIVHWTFRQDAGDDATRLIDLVGDRLPDGDGFVWIAGEAAVARAVRTHVIDTLGHPRSWVKAAGYWTKGRADAHARIDD